MDYGSMKRDELQKLVREKGIGPDGSPGPTSWAASRSRETLVAALAAHESGTPLLTLETAPTKDAAELLRQAVEILSAGRQGGNVDEAAIRRIAKEEAARMAVPHTIVTNGPHDTEPLDVGITHPIYERVLRTLVAGKNVWLVGPPGCGKSHLGRQVALALGKAFKLPDYRLYCDSWNNETPLHQIGGYMAPQLNGPPVFVSTEFHRGCTIPGLYLADEVDKGSAGAVGSLNLGLDAPVVSFACGLIAKHGMARFMAGTNTPGLGATPMYPDRNVLPADFRSRWVMLRMDVDEKLERTIALSHNAEAGDWVTFVQEVRVRIAKAGLPINASPRAAIDGADLMTLGYSRKEIEQAVLWQEAPDAMVRRAKGDA